MVLDIVSRKDWGALPATGELEKMVHPVEYVIYTHTLQVDKCYNQEECSQRLQQIQKSNMEAGHPDILYNFLIGNDGQAYEGRGWWYQPDRSLRFPEYHGNRIDFAYIGNFATFEDVPLTLQCAAFRLVQCGVDFAYLTFDHTAHFADCPNSKEDCRCKTSPISLTTLTHDKPYEKVPTYDIQTDIDTDDDTTPVEELDHHAHEKFTAPEDAKEEKPA